MREDSKRGDNSQALLSLQNLRRFDAFQARSAAPKETKNGICGLRAWLLAPQGALCLFRAMAVRRGPKWTAGPRLGAVPKIRRVYRAPCADGHSEGSLRE